MGQKLNFKTTPISGLYIVSPNIIEDERGIFYRTFCADEFKEIDFDGKFVQMNHSINFKKGTLRGMHFQKPGASEEKLIRCTRGEIFDVVVDIRSNSPTFLKYFAVELNENNKLMLLLPKGCAHGFVTLKDNSEVQYCHTQFYNQSEESGLRYDDPLINISWPCKIINISNRDLSHKYLSSSFSGYNYEM